MATNPTDILRDPEFQKFSLPEKQAILQKVDPEFAALSSSEQGQALARITSTSSPAVENPQMFLDRSRTDMFKREHPLETIWQGSKQGLKEFSQPIAEGLALGTGAIVGAPIGGPVGSAVGAGLLYSAARQAFDNNKRGSFTEAGKDVVSGSAMEAGGQVAGAVLSPALKAAGWLWGKMPSFGTKALEKEAGQILVKNTSNGPIYAKNIEEATNLEKEIQGLNFTRGQQSSNPSVISKERSLFAATPEGKQALSEQTAQSNEAIRQYYEKGFQGDTANTLNAIKRSETGINQMKSAAEQNVTKEVSQLNKGANAQTAGQTVLSELQSAKETARLEKNKLYQDIPNVPVAHSNELVNEIKKISQPYGAFENIGSSGGMHGDGGNLPSVFKDVQHILKGPGNANLGFQDLQSLKARLNNDIRMESSGQSPNQYKLKRLNELKDWTITSMKRLEQSDKYGPISDQFKTAEKFYKEQYVPFKQGSIGEVLRPTAQGDLRVDSSQVIDKFFNTSKLDDADAFIKSVGNNAKANQAVKDYASQKLLNEATDPLTGDISSKKLAWWTAKNKVILNKFGLQNDFNNITQAQKTVDTWRGISDNFEKSVAAKMITDNASGITFEQGISQAMQSPQKIRQLMNVVKGDKAGEAGLRKGIGDYILNQSRTTAEDIKNNPLMSTAKITNLMRKYEPALREIYKDNPKQLETLKNINRAYEILARTQRPTLSGSDTVEKLMPILQQGGNIAERLPVVGQAVGAYRTITRLFQPYGKEKINQFLIRASFDPEYADTLFKAAKNDSNKVMVSSRIKNQMLTLGIYDLKKSKE